MDLVAGDRLSAALEGVVRSVLAEFPYAQTHAAKLTAQRSKTRVDIEPLNRAIPPMGNIPLELGVPGVEVTIKPGHRVLFGWRDAQPDQPFVTLWLPGGAGVIPDLTSIIARALELGAAGATEAVVLGTSYRRQELRTMAQISAWAQAVAAAIASDSSIPPNLRGAVVTLTTSLVESLVAFNADDFLSQSVTVAG